jgi:DNA repair protein RecO (recombination protein O)
VEWQAPAIVLDARAYGEGDAIATVLTEEHGRHRGLARGGFARGRAAVWQPGNLIQARWVGRLSEQLGSFTAELGYATAALYLEAPLPLAVLTAACAVAESALPEREPHGGVFGGLLRLIANLGQQDAIVGEFVRWEAGLLAELGYGLDLSRCAVTGQTNELHWVSPKTGRAVSDGAAGIWKSRLLRLPDLLLDGGTGGADDWRDGLRLTGHFLARDVFGLHHRPVPAARLSLYDRVVALAEAAESPQTECPTI